jgi:SOS-response transcriptional repressor LexA
MRKEKVFEFIKNYIIKNRRSPSLDEIMAGCGILSKSHAHSIVEKIVAVGLLEKLGGARGLRLPNSRMVEEA